MPNNRRSRRPYRQSPNPAMEQHRRCVEPPQPEQHIAMATAASADTPRDELAKLRQDLSKQKLLKEMFMKREQETRSELETLQRSCGAESLEHATAAQKVRESVKHRQKKLLEVDYEELQEAFLLSHDRFHSELQLQRAVNKELQEELCTLTSSFNELRAKFQERTLRLGGGRSAEEESASGSQESEELKEHIRNLQKELNEEQKQKSVMEEELKKLQLQCWRSQDEQTAALQQEKKKTLSLEERLEQSNQTLQDKEEEAAQLQQQLEAEAQQAALLKEQHEELQKLHQDSLHHREEEVRKQQQDVERKDDDNKNLLQQLEQLQDKLREKETQLQELRRLTTEEEEKLPEKKKKPSFWTWLQHVLGLRK